MNILDIMQERNFRKYSNLQIKCVREAVKLMKIIDGLKGQALPPL